MLACPSRALRVTRRGFGESPRRSHGNYSRLRRGRGAPQGGAGRGGRTIAARQIACPLWKGLDALNAAFAEAAPLLARADSHAATMTGELCELFPDRPSGVAAILDRLISLLVPTCAFGWGRAGSAAPMKRAPIR